MDMQNEVSFTKDSLFSLYFTTSKVTGKESKFLLPFFISHSTDYLICYILINSALKITYLVGFSHCILTISNI